MLLRGDRECATASHAVSASNVQEMLVLGANRTSRTMQETRSDGYRQWSAVIDLEGSGSARPASVSVTATLRDANVVRSTRTTSLRVALLDQRLY